jgi:hypothetical protein
LSPLIFVLSRFSNDIQNFIVGSYPDHLPESLGNRFSLYLSTKLCHGIVLALRIQLSYFTSKYMCYTVVPMQGCQLDINIQSGGPVYSSLSVLSLEVLVWVCLLA